MTASSGRRDRRRRALPTLIVEAKPDALVNDAGCFPAGRSEVAIVDLNLRSALVAASSRSSTAPERS